MTKFTKTYEFSASAQSRRSFLKTSSLAGAAVFAMPYLMRSQDAAKKLNMGIIGTGGKGSVDLGCVSSQNIVAVCDVDEGALAAAMKKHPKAKPYSDYRKLFDEMGKSLDAVTVSTPDHHH